MPALASRDFEAPKSNEATSPIPILRFIKANTFIATERPLAKQLNLVILHYATSGILVFLEDVDQLLKLASIEPGAAKFSMAKQLADPVVPDDDDSNQEADTEAEPEAIARVERDPPDPDGANQDRDTGQNTVQRGIDLFALIIAIENALKG